MNNLDVDKIVNDLVYEAFTGGPRNSITGGDSQRAYLANELVAGASAFAHSVPGGMFADLNNMIQDQQGKLGATTSGGGMQEDEEVTVGHLMSWLTEAGLNEAVEAIQEICEDPVEEDAELLHEMATYIAKNYDGVKLIVENIHIFAENVRELGRLNESGYDVAYYTRTGIIRLEEEEEGAEASPEGEGEGQPATGGQGSEAAEEETAPAPGKP